MKTYKKTIIKILAAITASAAIAIPLVTLSSCTSVTSYKHLKNVKFIYLDKTLEQSVVERGNKNPNYYFSQLQIQIDKNAWVGQETDIFFEIDPVETLISETQWSIKFSEGIEGNETPVANLNNAGIKTKSNGKQYFYLPQFAVTQYYQQPNYKRNVWIYIWPQGYSKNTLTYVSELDLTFFVGA